MQMATFQWLLDSDFNPIIYFYISTDLVSGDIKNEFFLLTYMLINNKGENK